jgi:hypothetical protein
MRERPTRTGNPGRTRRLLICPQMSDRVVDAALVAFRVTFVDQGPEKVP